MTVKRVSKLKFDWEQIEKISSAESSFGAMRRDIEAAQEEVAKQDPPDAETIKKKSE